MNSDAVPPQAAAMAAPQYVFRFRSFEKLLGRNELRDQHIYFASIEQLNDPMEGFLNLVWQGDRIVWQNLFRQYLLCLDRLVGLLAIGGRDFEVSVHDLDVFSGIDDLPTEAYKNRLSRLYSIFFSNTQVDGLIGFLGTGRRIRRSELLFYLSLVHEWATQLATASWKKQEATDAEVPLPRLLNDGLIETLKHLESESDEVASFLFDLASNMRNESALIASYSAKVSGNDGRLALLNFPSLYLERLEALCYPPWYTACFMGNCSDAAVWGHYGDSHKGVCLKFKTTTQENGRVGLVLGNHIKGYAMAKEQETRKIRGEQFLPLKKIEYVGEYPEVQFFRSIGRLSWPRVQKTWFSDEKGARSSVAHDVQANTEEWRRQHWEMFSRTSCTKLKAWEYEDEHRLVLSGMLDDLKDPGDRVLRFRFSDLDGVIFGMRTPLHAKHEIMKIVEEKCAAEKRTDFRFYQAQYSPTSGSMAIHEMKTFKIVP